MTPNSTLTDTVRRLPVFKLGTVVLATLAAQASSAAGISMLPFVSGRIADTYALAIQVGTVALGGVVLGVVYNLAIGRPGFNRWRLCQILALLFSLSAAFVASALSFLTGTFEKNSSGLISAAIVITYGLGGGLLSIAAVIGVREACQGRPMRLASVAIVPNASFAVGVLILALSGSQSCFVQIVPAIFWVSAAALVLILYSRTVRPSNERVSAGSGLPQTREFEHTVALLIGVISSAVVPTLSLVALGQLGGGQSALLFTIGRMVSSVIGVGVNSVLLVKYSWNTDIKNSGRFIERLAFAAFLLLSFGIALRFVFNFEFWSYAFVVCSWILLLVNSAFLLRETNARRYVRAVSWKVAVDAVFSLLLLSFLFDDPTPTGYFGIFITSQVVTAAVCGLWLSRYWLFLSAIATIPLSALLVLDGW